MMKKIKLVFSAFFISASTIGFSGCSSFQTKPISPIPEGVSISPAPNGGYVVDSVEITKNDTSATPESLAFCFAQNIPSIKGSPTLNPSGTKITAQGGEQVSFIVPMTMGTPLNYDMKFSTTAYNNQNSLEFKFTNIKITGTWSNNENPMPASQDAELYVKSSLEAFNRIANNLHNCLMEEI